MKERLNKILSHAGIASRRAADELIKNGFVKVSGRVELNPGRQVDPRKEHVLCRGKRVLGKEPKVYFALNKPPGYICSNRRTAPDTKLAIDLLGKQPYRLYTIGRLDKASTGLIIITNDGAFANQVGHPSSNIEKEYLVKVAALVSDQHLKEMMKGCRIEGRFVKPTSVKKMRKGTIKITVKEGKKHEVRILCKKADLPVRELKRIRIGNLKLGNLPTGVFKSLNEKECIALSNRFK